MTALSKPDKSMEPVFTLVKNTWGLYRSHVSLFIGYSTWMLIPMVLNVLLTVTFGADYTYIIEPIVLVLDILIMTWVIISLIQVTPLAQSKKRIDTRKVGASSWHLAVPFLLLTLLLSVLTVVGFVLFIIPGIVFAIYITFASAILVLERTKIIESIKKSFVLVQGRFWTVLHRVFFGNLILLIPYLVAMIIIASILLMAHNGDVDALVSSPATLMEQILVRVIDACLIPLFVIFGVILYQNAKKTQS